MTRNASSRPARKRASSCSSERRRSSGVGSARGRGTAVATAYWNVPATGTDRFSYLSIRCGERRRSGGMRQTLFLLLVFLAVAAPARAAGPEIGVADDRILMAGGEQADRVGAEWQGRGGAVGGGVVPSAPGTSA